MNNKVEILSSTFVNNKGSEAGGSLYLSCQKTNAEGKNHFWVIGLDCSFLVSDNIFAGNMAEVEGGAIFYNMISPMSLVDN